MIAQHFTILSKKRTLQFACPLYLPDRIATMFDSIEIIQ